MKTLSEIALSQRFYPPDRRRNRWPLTHPSSSHERCRHDTPGVLLRTTICNRQIFLYTRFSYGRYPTYAVIHPLTQK